MTIPADRFYIFTVVSKHHIGLGSYFSFELALNRINKVSNSDVYSISDVSSQDGSNTLVECCNGSTFYIHRSLLTYFGESLIQQIEDIEKDSEQHYTVHNPL